MTRRAHVSSVIEAGARLGADVVIGPFCHVGADVTLGDGVELVSHVVLAGDTRVGARTKIFPFASIGAPSQDLKAGGKSGRLILGADCVIREGVTMNAGGPGEGEETRVGDRCALLAYSHVAHDCVLGEGVILSNNVLLGGHVRLGDHVMIGGASAVHQYTRVGAHAFVAGLSGVEGDVPPFTLASGNRAHLFGLNLVGLRRRGFSPERIAGLRSAYRLLFPRDDPSPLATRVEALAKLGESDADIALMIAFLCAPSSRPLCAPRAGGPS
ncbi:MAG: acyl-ACP--UDP-N-acetylglucosamine O-acyltransferase [Methylocystis sp.]